MISHPPTSVTCPVLIGREADLDQLSQALSPISAGGSSRVLLISGEAGIGKSRLTAELQARATSAGFTLLAGRCFEPDRTLPYAPLIDLLGGLSAAWPAAGAELARLFPDRSEAEPEPGAGDLALAQRRLFDALARCLLAAPPAGPRLLVVEDVHWCDGASLEFLSYLARARWPVPLRLLLTYRNDEISPVLRHSLVELDRQRLAVEVALRRLSVAETEAMIRAIFTQAQPVRAEFVDAVHHLTDGNPFFVEEVLRALIAAGDIYYDGSGWTRRPLEALSIPRSVQDAVARRTQQLSEPARRLLAVAAVSGRRFDFNLLQGVTEADEATVLAQVKELLAAQLVVEASAETFAFRHALTRQAVYAGLLARERRAWHLAVAVTLERAANPTASSDLARHFFEAEAWEPALVYARQAGERAQALYAPRAAAEHYTRALEAARRLGRVLAELWRARGQAWQTLGEFAAAQADFEQALSAAGASRNRRAEWQALLDLGFWWAARDYTPAGEYFQRALRLARQIDEPAPLAHTLNRVGNWHANLDQPLEALRCHLEALGIFETLDDQAGLAATLDLLGIASYIAGDAVRGVAYYERAIALFRELNDRGGLLSGLMMYSTRGADYLGRTVAPGLSRLSDRLRDGEEALRLAREIEARPGEALGQIWVGLSYAIAGQYGPALDLLRAGLTMAEAMGHRHFMATGNLVLGALYSDLLALPAARRHLEQALALGRETRSLVWTRVAAGFLVSVHVQENDLDAAEAVLAGVFTPELPYESVGQRQVWFARAEVFLAQGQPWAALEIVEKLVATAPSTPGVQAIPAVALLQGAALAAVGQTADAENILRAALETAQAGELPPLVWRLDLALGRLYLTLGRRDAAAEAFAGARSVVESLAEPLTEASLAETLRRGAAAGMARVKLDSPRRKAKQAAAGLTRREQEVATLVAEGRSNREIATTLHLSPRTVEVHIANIMGKLSLDTRAQIAVWTTERRLRKS
ncbi:MAG: AAA family ATPase [Anaerolineales bacterium]|nr:AAA family ATPase [Anaerolineales bacterium]